MTGPIDFNPFKNIGGAERIYEMTGEREKLELPEIKVPEQPEISIDSQDEDGLIDIVPEDFGSNFDFNKKFPKF